MSWAADCALCRPRLDDTWFFSNSAHSAAESCFCATVPNDATVIGENASFDVMERVVAGG
ncbi:protein of unknown function [Agreia sp. COWG]|nr:protein of unknown function [Agreia sp. COWG]